MNTIDYEFLVEIISCMPREVPFSDQFRKEMEAMGAEVNKSIKKGVKLEEASLSARVKWLKAYLAPFLKCNSK